LLVASQSVTFIQLPKAHEKNKPTPAAGARPAGAAAKATAVAAVPRRKITSSGNSSSSRKQQ